MTRPLEYRDIDMMVYYYTEYQNIPRWGEWEERRSMIAARYPELVAAVDALVIAEKTLKRLLDSVEMEALSELKRDD